MIAYAASNTGDKVGVLLVTDRVEKIIELKKGRNHVLRIIRDLLTHPTRPGGTALRKALEETRRLMKHSGIVFVLSDFKAEGFEIPVRQLARKHDVVAIRIEDDAEIRIQTTGRFPVLDPETGRMFELDTRSNAVNESLRLANEAFDLKTRTLFKQAGVETLPIQTREDHAERLLQFLRRRKQKR
jgi:uncharacterized protein (DUF58 family)